jgi:hypothetical protein
MLIAISFNSRDVVFPHWAIEPYLEIRFHRFVHIRFAFVVKSFFEIPPVTFDIAEVNKENFLALAKVFYHARYVFTHCCKSPLA